MDISKFLRIANQATTLVSKLKRLAEKKIEKKKVDKGNEKLVVALMGLGYKREEAERRAEGIDGKKVLNEQVREALQKWSAEEYMKVEKEK